MARILAVLTSAVAAGFACLMFFATGAAAVEQPRIVVMVYNRSHTPRGEVAEAQMVAQRALKQAGIESTWLSCLEVNPAAQCSQKPGDGRLVVTLVPWWSGRETDRASLGLALPIDDGIGSYCYVFEDRLVALVAEAHANPSGLLGYAMAHEIGHLLKGSNSHSPEGIMAAWWRPTSIQAAGMGALKFTEGDRQAMQKKLRQYSRVH